MRILHEGIRSDRNGIGIYHFGPNFAGSSLGGNLQDGTLRNIFYTRFLTFDKVTVKGDFRISLYIAPGGVTYQQASVDWPTVTTTAEETTTEETTTELETTTEPETSTETESTTAESTTGEDGGCEDDSK